MAKPISINHPMLKQIQAQLQAKRKPSKYRNIRTEYQERFYDSKAEAKYAEQLDFLKQSGEIRHWEPQPKFRLGNHINVYKGDFLVWNLDGSTYVVDRKGKRTAKFIRDVKLWKMFGPCELHIVGDKDVEIIRPDWMEGATS